MKTIRERILANIEIVDDCWLWKLSRHDSGYGGINVDNRSRYAHRASYEAFIGAVPAGMTLDHTCHSNDLDCFGGRACLHRACVNPGHLEPVTVRENARRGRNTDRSAA